jgi:hypothetical protein
VEAAAQGVKNRSIAAERETEPEIVRTLGVSYGARPMAWRVPRCVARAGAWREHVSNRLEC